MVRPRNIFPLFISTYQTSIDKNTSRGDNIRPPVLYPKNSVYTTSYWANSSACYNGPLELRYTSVFLKHRPRQVAQCITAGWAILLPNSPHHVRTKKLGSSIEN
jgi:hypothetical protein